MTAKTILIVDDEKSIRDILLMAFEMDDYVVHLANGGDEAFSKIQEGQFDLILSDVRMPEGGGVELLANVCRLESPPKIVMMSGFTEVEGAELVERGAASFVGKPFQLDEILDLVENLIDKE